MNTMSTNRQLISPNLNQAKQLPYPVFIQTKDIAGNAKVIGHKYNWHVLVYAENGFFKLSCMQGDHLIPRHKAIWIPKNQYHSLITEDQVSLKLIHLAPKLVPHLSEQITVLDTTPLFIALLNKANGFVFSDTIASNFSTVQTRLLNVFVDEINQLPSVDLCLPLSNDPLLLPILIWQQHHIGKNKTLQQWADELKKSNKTIARRFDSKLNLSYTQWREQLRLQHAIILLNQAQPVNTIALQLGYDSVPAFIQMFKRHIHTTPGKFMAENK
jgi:AraC-like DNA-binding protein